MVMDRQAYSSGQRLYRPRSRRPLHCWELLLPAGIWINAGKGILAIARMLQRSGLRLPYGVFLLIRLSGRLSHIGFRVWRHRRGKWR
jgi:hypothetical protein